MTEIELLNKIANLLEIQLYVNLMWIAFTVVIRNVRKGRFR